MKNREEMMARHHNLQQNQQQPANIAMQLCNSFAATHLLEVRTKASKMDSEMFSKWIQEPTMIIGI